MQIAILLSILRLSLFSRKQIVNGKICHVVIGVVFFTQGFIKFRKRCCYIRYHNSEIAQPDRCFAFLNTQCDLFFMRPPTINRPMLASIEILYTDNFAPFIVRTESHF